MVVRDGGLNVGFMCAVDARTMSVDGQVFSCGEPHVYVPWKFAVASVPLKNAVTVVVAVPPLMMSVFNCGVPRFSESSGGVAGRSSVIVFAVNFWRKVARSVSVMFVASMLGEFVVNCDVMRVDDGMSVWKLDALPQ